MGKAARILKDTVKHASPHCHAPIHPAAPVPTPLPHAAKELKLMLAGMPTVKVNGKDAAVMGSMSEPCMLPSCVPAGPGLIAMGSTTVMLGGLPAGRKDDMVAFASCVAPIPAPIGKVSTGSDDVTIGG